MLLGDTPAAIALGAGLGFFALAAAGDLAGSIAAESFIELCSGLCIAGGLAVLMYTHLRRNLRPDLGGPQRGDRGGPASAGARSGRHRALAPLDKIRVLLPQGRNGSMRASARRSLAASIIAAFVLALASLPAAQATYPRPRSAPAVKVSLVPAFNACSSPNRQHGPPLDDGSCSPPAQSSTAVTIGTPENNMAGDNSEGNIKWTVSAGTPGLPEDSDVLLSGSISDVRCIGGTTTCGEPTQPTVRTTPASCKGTRPYA